MKRSYFILSVLILIVTTTALKAQNNLNKVDNLVDLVNPLVGSDSEFVLSNGNTYPAIATPWGMNFWTPQTGKMGDGWGYTYDANKIRGFKQTHQPSPWINDYAAFSLFPETGKIKLNGDKRASWFSHKTEVSKPHYYKVYLADFDITTEITPTERGAQFQFTFPKSDEAHILIDGFFKGSMVKVYPEERKIVGYCRNNSGGVPENFHNYFVIYFDKDFENIQTWNINESENLNDENLKPDLNAEGYHVGAVLSFKTAENEKITAKVASSFISLDQAEINLKREINTDTFDQTKNKSEKLWNNELNKIEGIKCNIPQGAFYIFPDVSFYFGKSNDKIEIKNANDFCMFLLNSCHVALVAGDAFGNPECVRISYAAADEQLLEAAKRIKTQLNTLS